MPKEIDSLHVFISTKDGTEGVMVFRDASGKIRPMISNDQAEIEKLRGVAQTIARTHGVPVKLVKFVGRDIVECF